MAVQLLRAELNHIALVAADGDPKQAAILEQRLGWDGCGGADWDELAERHALPAADLSHKATLCLERLRVRRVASPVLDDVITAVNLTIPAPADVITNQLVELGLIDHSFDFRGIDTAGAALGKRRSWAVVRCGQIRLLADRNERRIAALVTRALNKSLRCAGVARAADVLAAVRSAVAQPISRRQVDELVAAHPAVAPLPGMPGWFWQPGSDANPLLKDIGKVLSVVHVIEIGTLRQGLLRSQRGAAACPPEAVLAALSRAAFKLRADQRRVVLPRPLPASRFLDRAERVLVKILQRDAALTRREIQVRWLEHRGDLSGLDRLLHRSPIVEQLGRGVYSLRGGDVGPSDVQRVASTRAARRQVLDYGWQQDGCLWLRCRVTTSVLGSGRLMLPTGLRRFLVGEFALRDTHGTTLAKGACSASGSLPLQGYLKPARPALDAILYLVFDPHARTLRVGPDT